MSAPGPVVPEGGSVGGARRTRLLAAVVVVVCAVTFAVLYVVFVTTRRGQLLDHAAFQGAARGQGELWRVAQPVLDVVSEGFVVVGLVAAVLIALVRRRWSLAVEAASVIVGSNLTTQLLKHELARSDLGIGRAANSFPSGHTTVAASVVVALLIAAPRRWRPTIALVGALYAAGTGVSVLVGQWHRASDAVAALVLVTLWCAVATLVGTRGSRDDVLTSEQPSSQAVERLLAAGGTVLALLSGIGGVVLAGRLTHGAETPDQMLSAYMLGMVAVAGASCLSMATVLALRQRATAP